jgi:hypothetical protein
MKDLSRKPGNYYKKSVEDIGISSAFLNRTSITQEIRARKNERKSFSA